VVITSLGARPDINAAIHSYGGIVFHDVIDDRFARKAVEKGADGLIAVAAGAGGHAGTLSPFALVQEIRRWFDGPVALSGAIATGGRWRRRGDGRGPGLYRIGVHRDRGGGRRAGLQADDRRGSAEDIVYSNLFTGVHGNYLAPSIARRGWTRPRCRRPTRPR
jgi:nitronate monooxygenase